MSSETGPRGCPEASVLAAYTEGGLDTATRRGIERHVSTCPECPLVIASTVRFLSEESEPAEGDAEESPDPQRTRWWRVAVAAAVAAFCIPAVVWQMATNRDPLRRVRQIAAEAAVRPIEGRLTAFAHVPFARLRSGAAQAADLALRAEAERLNETRRSDAASLHARGVALLLTGDSGRAVQLIAAATRSEPGRATLWSDLAAAHLAAAAAGDRRSLEAALHAATRALELEPALADARFNHAVALQHLGRRGQAAAAYRELLTLERDGRWRDEIAERIRLLEE